MDLQDIYACSVDKIVIADSVGVLIYDRKEQKIKYAVNLMGTGCQYFDSYSIRTQVKMSKNGKYIVTKIETSKDGSEMAPSIRKICKGHPLIAERMIKEDFPERIKKKNVKKYVELNHLDINYYQNYGWDLQRIY